MNRDSRNKVHFWWFIVTVVCVIITYCYMKAKATDNYKTILQIASENCNLEIVKFSVENLLDTIVFPKVNDKGIIKYLSYNGI